MPSKTQPVAKAASQAPTPRFEPVRSARAFEEIATQIRTELTTGRLKVGSRLPAERALAVQFGVSRNTLREALRSLEHAGLIRLQKGATGGAFISEGSANVIVNSMLDLYHMGSLNPDQLTEARIWLEAVVVREACARATPEDLQALRENMDEAARATEEGDFQRRAQVHLSFHRILARMTGNPIMVIVMDGLLTVLAQFIQTIGAYENTFVLPSRKRFLKHLEEGNTEAAVAEMETSLRRLQRGYLSRVSTAATSAARAAPAARKRAPAAKKAAS
ncbi:MAG: FCD domain-containing protein [Hydrogenophaga sp.]|nr:FCD domain-containing protein [Hydrogenophaga sp.]